MKLLIINHIHKFLNIVSILYIEFYFKFLFMKVIIKIETINKIIETINKIMKSSQSYILENCNTNYKFYF